MKTDIIFDWPKYFRASLEAKHWHVTFYYTTPHRIGAFIEISLTTFGIVIHAGIVNFAFWIGKDQGKTRSIQD